MEAQRVEGTAPRAAVGRNYEVQVPTYRYYIKACQHTVRYATRIGPMEQGWCRHCYPWQPFTNNRYDVVEFLPRPARRNLDLLNPAEKDYERGRRLSEQTVALRRDKALLKNRVRDELVFRGEWTYDDAAGVAAFLSMQSEVRLSKIAPRRHRKDARLTNGGITVALVTEVMADLDTDVYDGHVTEHHEEEDAA